MQQKVSLAFTFLCGLSDESTVLEWIHGSGWVHRDISTGNLFLYNGRGLIGDLEYAKRRGTNVEDEKLVVRF